MRASPWRLCLELSTVGWCSLAHSHVKESCVGRLLAGLTHPLGPRGPCALFWVCNLAQFRGRRREHEHLVSDMHVL